MDRDLPERIFADPVWHALETTHRRFAVSLGEARRYPADIAPFGAVTSPTVPALNQLCSLLALGESIWIFGQHHPRVPGLQVEQTVECFQMVLPETAALPACNEEVRKLPDESASEMVELTNLAFPGFFRDKTCQMGSYYGVRSDGKLIAMGGERMMLDNYVEISAVCTHPEHRGKGYAASIIGQLARDHRRDGLVSWLHVSCENRNAIELYLRLGFKVIRKIAVSQFSRKE
jgi:ribosomal protein S18 acetylase RimI-like enzyme